MDVHAGLPIGGGGKGFGFLGGDGGVAGDKGGHHAAQSFQSQSERGNIQQHDAADIPGLHPGLDGRAAGHHFVRVDRAAGFFAKDGFDLFLHGGHPGHSADEDDFVDFGGGSTGVGEGLAAGAGDLIDQAADQLLEAGAAERFDQMLGSVGVGGDEGQVDFAFQGAGKLDFGPFRRIAEALESHTVVAQVNAGFLAEFANQPVEDFLVEVVAAEVGVAVGGFDLKDAIAELKDGDVKGAAAEVKDGDGSFVLLFVQAVVEGGGGGFVDNPQHIEAGDGAGVFGGLALGVIEISRHGDDSLGDFFAQLGFGVLADFLEDERGDLRRGVGLAGHFDMGVAVGGLDYLIGQFAQGALDFGVVKLAPHQPLDGKDGIFRVGYGLAFGDLAHITLIAAGVDGDYRGGDAAPFGVFHNEGFAGVDNGGDGVGGAEVDTEDFRHFGLLSLLWQMMVLRVPAGPVKLSGDYYLGGLDDPVAEAVAVADGRDDVAGGMVGGVDDADSFVLDGVEGLADGFDFGKPFGFEDGAGFAVDEADALDKGLGCRGLGFGLAVSVGQCQFQLVDDREEVDDEAAVGGLQDKGAFLIGAFAEVFEVGAGAVRHLPGFGDFPAGLGHGGSQNGELLLRGQVSQVVRVGVHIVVVGFGFRRSRFGFGQVAGGFADSHKWCHLSVGWGRGCRSDRKVG